MVKAQTQHNNGRLMRYLMDLQGYSFSCLRVNFSTASSNESHKTSMSSNMTIINPYISLKILSIINCSSAEAGLITSGINRGRTKPQGVCKLNQLEVFVSNRLWWNAFVTSKSSKNFAAAIRCRACLTDGIGYWIARI